MSTRLVAASATYSSGAGPRRAPSPCEKESDLMTPIDIDLVQRSFAKVAPIDDETGVLFYQRLFEIEPALRELAIRHAGYGVGPEHYASVGAALIWIMEQSLGDDFTDEVRSAWLAVYDALSGVMIAAAYRSAGAD